MKKQGSFLLTLMLLAITAMAQNNANSVERTLQKADAAVNRGKAIVNVFQPYLLKARELFAQARQIAKDVKASAKNVGKNSSSNNSEVAGSYSNGANAGGGSNTGTYTDTAPAYVPPANATATQNGTSAPAPQYGVYENYTPEQYLPVTNPAAVNKDGSGNWGNQNNGLYGNCLDVLTGTVLSMGEAEDKPGSIDLMFFAPSDGQNTYVLMTPAFAKNNTTATYMTQHSSDAVTKWKEVTESEVALTKLTIGQFDKIQTNAQISGAVKNAVNYSGWYTSVGNKLDGQVFAVKVEQENRTVYALIAVEKHFGTSGSNGYLKIKVKSQGIDTNNDGMADPSAYIR